MKKYEVVLTPEAQEGIRQAFQYIYQRAPLNAARWLQRLYAKIDTLERYPERCGYAREQEYLLEDKLDGDLRQLIFQSHRIVFQVRQQTVFVLYFRHAKQQTLGKPFE